MSAKPDVSIVMSVFNSADTLDETLQSILTQEGIKFELIAINDGSTDDSGKILDRYAEDDKRVRVVHQRNQGLTRSLIKGCELARGPLIARHDAGDISQPTRLYEQKKILDEYSDCSFVSCWTVLVGPAGEYLFTSKGKAPERQPLNIICRRPSGDYALLDGPTHHGTVMFRAEEYQKVGGYRSAFYYGQDWDLWYRLAACGKFGMVKKTLLRASFSPTSISFLRRTWQEKYATLSERSFQLRMCGLSDDQPLREAKKLRMRKEVRNIAVARSAGYYFVGRCLQKNGDRRATTYFVNSIRENPLFLRAWGCAAFSLAQRSWAR